MSDRAVKKEQNKAFPKALKWFLVILAIAGLEAGGIVAAVKITEMRRTDSNAQLKNDITLFSQQLKKLDSLEKISSLVSVNMQHLDATSHAVNLLSESIDQLEKEVGGNQIEKMNKKITDFGGRLDNVEEALGIEPIILTVALMIKEDSLSGRSFAEQADVLAALSQDIGAIQQDVEVVQRYKNDVFADNQSLTAQYKAIMADFSFKKAEAIPSEPKNTVLSKGVKILKDTVSSMHFDKVAVLKKQKKTDAEKNLLAELDTLVYAYKYDEALAYIKAHTEFGEANNQALNNWLGDVQKKTEFDKALNHIIAEQLKTLRKDAGLKTLALPQKKETAQPETSQTKDIADEKVL